MKKSKKAVAFLFVAIFILTAGIAVFTAGMIFKMDEIGKFSDKEAQYRLVIEKDDYEKEISKDLKENGIIKFPGYWRQYMKKEYPDFVYINGEYEFLTSRLRLLFLREAMFFKLLIYWKKTIFVLNKIFITPCQLMNMIMSG